jgi:Tfp pilus assembly protein PilF
MALQQATGAGEDFTQAIALAPKDYRAYAGRGLFLLEQGNYRQALILRSKRQPREGAEPMALGRRIGRQNQS